MAQSCNPATRGQGYGMELVTQVSITWLSLKWLVAALVLEAEWSWVWEIPLVLSTWNCAIAQGLGGAKLPFQCSPGSQSDCILLATNGDIQAINDGSSNVHINLHSVQKVD